MKAEEKICQELIFDYKKSSIPLRILKDIYLLFNKYVQMWLLRWKVETPTLEELQNSEKEKYKALSTAFLLWILMVILISSLQFLRPLGKIIQIQSDSFTSSYFRFKQTFYKCGLQIFSTRSLVIFIKYHFIKNLFSGR